MSNIYMLRKDVEGTAPLVRLSSTNDTSDWRYNADTIENREGQINNFLVNNLIADWKVGRAKMKEICLEKTNNFSDWNALNEAEKNIILKYVINLLPPQIIITYPQDYIQNCAKEFDLQNTIARRKRREKARVVVFNNVPIAWCMLLINDIILKHIDDKYFAWIESEATEWFSWIIDRLQNDLFTLDFTPYVLTKQQLSDALLNVFINW